MLAIGSAARTSDAPPRASLSGAIGPDGERLYLTGITQSSPNSDLVYVPQPAGLRVVDTRDGALATPTDPSVGQLALSPTGDRLMLVGWTTRTPGDGTSSTRVVDPALGLVARVSAIDGATTPYPAELATSWDGRHGYLVTNVRTGDDGHTQLTVINLSDGRVASRPQPDPASPVVMPLVLGGS
jgi:hypothetical protein